MNSESLAAVPEAYLESHGPYLSDDELHVVVQIGRNINIFCPVQAMSIPV